MQANKNQLRKENDYPHAPWQAHKSVHWSCAALHLQRAWQPLLHPQCISSYDDLDASGRLDQNGLQMESTNVHPHSDRSGRTGLVTKHCL